MPKADVVINLHLNKLIGIDAMPGLFSSLTRYFDGQLEQLTDFLKPKFDIAASCWEDFVDKSSSTVLCDPFCQPPRQFKLAAMMVMCTALLLHLLRQAKTMQVS